MDICKNMDFQLSGLNGINDFNMLRNIHGFFAEYQIELNEKFSVKPSFRFELVDKFNNVTYINDSKSTNFNSLSMATTKINNGILLLHGLTKNISSKDLKLGTII